MGPGARRDAESLLGSDPTHRAGLGSLAVVKDLQKDKKKEGQGKGEKDISCFCYFFFFFFITAGWIFLFCFGSALNPLFGPGVAFQDSFSCMALHNTD